MTQRYAHLANNTLLAATNAVVGALDGVVPRKNIGGFLSRRKLNVG